MKSALTLAIFASCVFGQRLSITTPTPQSTVAIGVPFIVELEQAVAQGILQQVSVTIAATPCFDVCEDPSQWGLATVLYNGAFHPQQNTSEPQAGLHQDFSFTLPEGWPSGGVAISVAHLVNIGAGLTPAFDYTDVLVNGQ